MSIYIVVIEQIAKQLMRHFFVDLTLETDDNIFDIIFNRSTMSSQEIVDIIYDLMEKRKMMV